MVVRLDFERQVKQFVKLDDAGIVDKGGTDPGPVHGLGCRLNVTVQQSLNLLYADGAAGGIL